MPADPALTDSVFAASVSLLKKYIKLYKHRMHSGFVMYRDAGNFNCGYFVGLTGFLVLIKHIFHQEMTIWESQKEI